VISQEDTKNIVTWIVTTIGTLTTGLLLWLAKSTHDKWKQVIAWHQMNKDINVLNIAQEIVTIKNEQLSIKNEQLRITTSIKESFTEQKALILEMHRLGLEVQEANTKNIFDKIETSNNYARQFNDTILKIIVNK
jgi:hypothetical protein